MLTRNTSKVVRALARSKSSVARRSGGARDTEVTQHRRGGGGQLAQQGFSDLSPFAGPLGGALAGPLSNPLALATSMARDMEAVMNNLARPLLGGSLFGGRGGLPSLGFGMGGFPRLDRMDRDVDAMMQRTLGMPSSITLDVAEKPDAYELHAELPGVSKENVRIEVDEVDRLLTITAEKSVGPPAGSSTPTGAAAASAEGKEGQVGEQQQQEAGAEAAADEPASASGKGKAKGKGAGAGAGAAVTRSASGSGGDVTQWHRVERAMGTVSRTITLPVDVDLSAPLSAKMEAGVLTVTLPKVKGGAGAKEGRKTIDIQ